MLSEEKTTERSLVSQQRIRGARWARARLWRLSLAVLLLTLLALVLGLGILFHGDGSCSAPAQDSPGLSCLSPACLSVTAHLSSSLDPYADQCQDFFQFACGARLREPATGGRQRGRNRQLQPGRPASSPEQRGNARQRMLRDILESPKGSGAADSAEEKAGRFYRSCMDTARITDLGAQPALELIEQLGGWPVSGVWKRSDFNATLRSLMRDYSTFPFFSVYIGRDPQDLSPNSTAKYIQIDQPDFQIPAEWNTKDRKPKAEVVRIYISYLVSLLSLLGIQSSPTSMPTGLVTAFASELSRAATPLRDRKARGLLYQRTTIAQLQEAAPAVDWLSSLEATFHPIQLNESDVIFVHDFPYLISMSRSVSNWYKLGTVHSYMILSLLHTVLPALDSRFTELRLNLSNALEDTRERAPRWQECVSQTERVFESALGAMFIDQTFTAPTQEEQAEDLISNIYSSLKAKLVDLQWKDAETKSIALEKIQSLPPRLAKYPGVLDRRKLNEHYSQVSVSEDVYFMNYLQSLSISQQRKMRLLSGAVDTDMFSLSPVSGSPSLCPSGIVFPPGMFHQPLFHPDYPRAVNYGAMGTAVAKGILHLLLSHIEGALSPAASPLTLTECLMLQFRNSSREGDRSSFQVTSEEQWLLHMAFEVSFQAYAQWLLSAPGDFSLSGLSHTQLFFTSFAQMLCSSDSDLSIPDSSFLVNSVCANSDLCSQKLGCSPDSPLNPRKKC
ncbi:kell blood group glycoprotein isoform X1 [Lepisosteus oculatus]|uniref:kell blood group glycoprotein isoform X1 n=1 Tax=Lepisosteus oculatus TaxID=7918 RepID=UPI00371143D8